VTAAERAPAVDDDVPTPAGRFLTAPTDADVPASGSILIAGASPQVVSG
jgi:hypothetical protein